DRAASLEGRTSKVKLRTPRAAKALINAVTKARATPRRRQAGDTAKFIISASPNTDWLPTYPKTSSPTWATSHRLRGLSNSEATLPALQGSEKQLCSSAATWQT